MSRGGEIGFLLAELEKHAKARGMLPEAAVLVHVPPANGYDPHVIDVYVGRRRATLFERHDFLPRFTPGMRKNDVQTVLENVLRVFAAMPGEANYQRKAVGWDGN